MAEDMNNANVSTSEMNIDGFGFLLFLILILLFIGNNNTFNSYFQVFDKEINRLNNVLGAFSTTAEGLKSVFSTSFEFE